MTTALTLNIKEGLIEFKQDTQLKYELIKWNGDTCYVLGFYEYNKKEPDWEFRSVGSRLYLDSNDYESQENIWKVLEHATKLLKNITL